MGLQQLNLAGLTKTEEAIRLIQEYEPPEGYYLCNSGGVDSRAVDDLVRQSKVKFDAHYNVSPIDPPEIRQFLKETFDDLAWDYHARGFFNLVMRSGLPTRRARWCCRLIKEAGGQGRIKILGMRSEESNTRRNYKYFQRKTNDETTAWLLPIVNWTRVEVWQYIYEHNLTVCSLYREGFNRIGCVLCPFLTAEQTAFQIKRFPKIAKAWRATSDRYFYKRIERGTPLPYKTPDEFWEWWISRK